MDSDRRRCSRRCGRSSGGEGLVDDTVHSANHCGTSYRRPAIMNANTRQFSMPLGATLAALAALFFVPQAAAQFPLSPSGPILGYVFDVNDRSIKAIAGVIGSSHIGPPVELGFSLTQAAILPGQASAIASSDRSPEVIVVGLETSP